MRFTERRVDVAVDYGGDANRIGWHGLAPGDGQAEGMLLYSLSLRYSAGLRGCDALLHIL